MNKQQSGFTLVEIAIVLVIIGLLLGGVLKGQELITQAKIKNVANDLNGMSAAVYGYQDRYRRFPGDDNAAADVANGAAGRWGAQTANGNGNAQVGATGVNAVIDCAQAANAALENCLFWQHLRLSGFIGGDTGNALASQNAVGGVLHVQNGALGLTGLVICTTNLPGKVANAIDAQFDDGRPGAGQVRGIAAAAAGAYALAAAPEADETYVDDGAAIYAVCKLI